MNYINSFNMFGVEAKQNPSITGAGAPTSATEGAVGCLYMDTNNGEMYKCISSDNGSYKWVHEGEKLGDLYIVEKQGEWLYIDDMAGSVQRLVSYIDGRPKKTNPNLAADLSWDYHDEVTIWSSGIYLPAGTYTVRVYDEYMILNINGNGVEEYVSGGETVTFTTTEDGYLAFQSDSGEISFKLEVGTTYTPDKIVRPNLITDSNWNYDEESGNYSCNFSNLPEGTYTIYTEADLIGSCESQTPGEPFTFYHKGGYLSLHDSSLSQFEAKLEQWHEYTGEPSQPNLIPVDLTQIGNWIYQEVGEQGIYLYYYEMELPKGTYTLHVENNSMGMNLYAGEEHLGYADDTEDLTFTHQGGTIRLVDTNYSAENISLDVIKIEKGSEYTGSLYPTYDTKYDEVVLTVNDKTYTANLPTSTVVGRYDWHQGLLMSDGDIYPMDEVYEIEIKNNSTIRSSTGETSIMYGADINNAIDELQSKTEGAISYTKQKLTTEQQAQARANIGVASEKALIEKLAPTFKKTGDVVTCNPVEGYPLEVVSYLQNIVTDLLSGVELVYDDEEQICYLETAAPAGEYIVSASSEESVHVEAYNVGTESWDMLGIVPSDSYDDEFGIYSGTLTFTHPGGLLRVVGSWVWSVSATLTHSVDPGGITWVSLKHNGNQIVEAFPKAIKNGYFKWHTGELVEDNSHLNLTADYKDNTKWSWDDPDAQTYECYVIQNLPSGEYTLVTGENMITVERYDEDTNEWYNVEDMYAGPNTFHHSGGTLRLIDTDGAHYSESFVLKLVAGSVLFDDFTLYQLTPHEIIGVEGVNTLSSNTGDTEVSGRADPVTIINSLEQRLAALEAAIANKE